MRLVANSKILTSDNTILVGGNSVLASVKR